MKMHRAVLVFTVVALGQRFNEDLMGWRRTRGRCTEAQWHWTLNCGKMKYVISNCDEKKEARDLWSFRGDRLPPRPSSYTYRYLGTDQHGHGHAVRGSE